MASKPWSGRFTEKTDKLVEEFNASISFDKRLYKHDIMGSITHARMLAKVGILTKKEVDKIISGLKAIEKEIVAGKFRFTPDLEDIHMAIEKRLIEKIGPVGGEQHTARSRNEQVALDVRLYLKAEIAHILSLMDRVRRCFARMARRHRDVLMPGYTHLQPAQPVLFAHHLLAYAEMFAR